METCGMSVVKYLIFIFNLLFAISGIGIIIAGALVLSNVGEYDHFMDGRLLAPPIVLIVAGSIVFIVAFLGCFGAIRESYNLLMAFAVCLVIIFIMELAVGIAAAVYKNDFQVALKDSLKESLKNYTYSEVEKKAWDNVQQKLQCCGVDGLSDWKVAIPESCCQENPAKSGENPGSPCNKLGKNKNYLRTTGCYEKLKMEAQSDAQVLIGVGIGIAFVELIGIVLSCWLASTIKRENAK